MFTTVQPNRKYIRVQFKQCVFFSCMVLFLLNLNFPLSLQDYSARHFLSTSTKYFCLKISKYPLLQCFFLVNL